MLLRPEGARFNSPGRRPGIQDDALTSPEGATLDARFPHESVTPADRPRTDGGDLAPQMPSFLARQNTNAVPVAAATFYAGGMKFLVLSALIYAPGPVLSLLARREQKETVFTSMERLVFGLVVVAALSGVYGLLSGSITV